MISVDKIKFTTEDVLLAKSLPRNSKILSVPVLWRSLFVIFCATKCSGDEKITLEVITAFLYHPYFVHCTVSFSKTSAVPKLQPTVFFEHVNFDKCEINEWLSCESAVPTKTGQCGCEAYMRPTESDDGTHYRMFYYLANVTMDYSDTLFKCSILEELDFGSVNIIRFNKRPPGGTLYNCSRGEVVLPWEFDYSRPEVESQFQIHRYEWIFYDHNTTTKSTIAAYDYTLSTGMSYIDEAVIFDDGKRLKKLRITNLSKAHMGFMKIRLYFTAILYNAPWEPPRYYFHGRKSLFNLSDVMHSHSENKNSAVISKSIRGHVYTHRLLPEHIEDEAQIFMTTPPSLTTIKLIAKIDRYGFSRIICTSKIKYFGNPPVNLTIFNRNVKLASRSHAGAVTYKSLTVGSQNISCGLTGPALACLSPSDSRCQRVHLDMSDIAGPDDGTGYLDWSFILYYTETCACILLLLWVIPLVLDHMRIALNRKHQIDKDKARRLREVSTQRATFYQELMERRMSARQAQKQRRKSSVVTLERFTFSEVPPTQKLHERDLQSVESIATDSSTD